MQAGGNILIGNPESIDVHVSWFPQNAAVELCAFVLNGDDKVNDDAGFISAGQPCVSHGFLSLDTGTERHPHFRVRSAEIPLNVKKIVFAATTAASFNSLFELNIEIKDVATFTPSLDAMQSLILGELYLHEQRWKFRAVGQGFNQGLSALADRYGVNVSNCLSRGLELAPGNQNLPLQSPGPSVTQVAEVLPPAPREFTKLQLAVEMVKEMSWGWIFTSFWVFVVLELILGGVIGKMVLGRFVPHMLSHMLEALLVLSSFFIGGAVVGIISPKVRIIEPAIAAFMSVILTLSLSFFSPYSFMSFTWNKVFFGGGFAFVLAFLGAHLGEKISAKMGNKHSQEIFKK
jgi:stress response protein SCP2